MGEVEYIAGLSAPHETHLNIAGLPFVIKVNQPSLHRTVLRYFSPFVDEPQPGAIEVWGVHDPAPYLRTSLLTLATHKTGNPKESFYDIDGGRAILKRRTGVVHYIHNNSFYAVGDMAKNPRQLINLVPAAFAHQLRLRGYVAIHASGISIDGSGIAFAGHSGSGKSTVALRLVESGCDFVSNDRVYLHTEDDAVVMWGAPKWPRVNPGTILNVKSLKGLVGQEEMSRYRDMDRDVLWKVESKHDVRVDDLWGRSRLALKSRLTELYSIAWRPVDQQATLTEVAPEDVPATVAPYLKAGVYDPPGAPHPDDLQLSEMLKSVSVFQATGGVDMDFMMERVLSRFSRVS